MLSSAPRQFGQLRRPITRIPTVCVVDPKADDYQGWNVEAQARGARLQVVASAEEALRLSRTTAVDLWVVNICLPGGLSGCELCGLLKIHSLNTPVYLIADQYAVSAERAAWQAGATVFGCKGSHTAWLEQWLKALGRGLLQLRPNAARPPVAVCD